ncbi:probable G-protein coupled receptor 132, partial [Megalops cyprinoides]|uniref:probable G-protein coupled receptor 132 n=1 Tax=Megalops cyprinoides TaxID=118141 RepID=UPI0018643B84
CTLPYSEDRVPLVALYSMVLVVGLPANLTTVYMTLLQVRRKNVLGIYLLSLSVCDLTYLCTLPLWAVYVAGGHQWLWSARACKVTGYVFFTNMYISIFLLCCVSVDRYVAVAYAMESRGLRRQKLAAAVTCAICLVVAAGHLPVFTMQEGDTGTGDKRCFEPARSSATVTGFNYARFLVGFLIPLGVLAVTNRAVLANVQASPGLRPGQKAKVKLLAATVVGLFLICFGPYHAILLLRAVMYHLDSSPQAECRLVTSIYTPYTISLGLSTINSATNPILYVLASDNIRKEIRQVLGSLHRHCTTPRPGGTSASQHNMHNARNISDAAPTHGDG